MINMAKVDKALQFDVAFTKCASYFIDQDAVGENVLFRNKIMIMKDKH